jgi:hypothetical protein
VQGAEARGNFDVAERKNARRFPVVVLVLKHEHVIGEELPESQVIKINLFQSALRSLPNLNVHLTLLDNNLDSLK